MRPPVPSPDAVGMLGRIEEARGTLSLLQNYGPLPQVAPAFDAAVRFAEADRRLTGLRRDPAVMTDRAQS